MLRREDSNKVLKGIKAVVFATGLTMLSPINVEAQEVNQEPTIEENNQVGDTIIEIVCGLAFIDICLKIYNYTQKEDIKTDNNISQDYKKRIVKRLK